MILSKQPKIEWFNEDCMKIMSEYPDKYFDLAIVDPPYGVSHSEIAGKQSGTQYGKAKAPKANYTVKLWDKNIPDKSYFEELFRVSQNQIIWGGNYMVEFLKPSMGWIFWDKDNNNNGFSDGELAFTNFKKGLRKVKITWNGMIQEDMKNKEIRIHPTQKPVQLYKWLLKNYAKLEFKIIDTHLGSGSSAIACYDFNINFVGCEIDEEYFNDAKKRFLNYLKKPKPIFKEEFNKPTFKRSLF